MTIRMFFIWPGFGCLKTDKQNAGSHQIRSAFKCFRQQHNAACDDHHDNIHHDVGQVNKKKKYLLLLLRKCVS